MRNRTDLFLPITELSKPFWKKKYLDRYKEIASSESNMIFALNLRRSVTFKDKKSVQNSEIIDDDENFVKFNEVLFRDFIAKANQTVGEVLEDNKNFSGTTQREIKVEIKTNDAEVIIEIGRIYDCLKKAGLSDENIAKKSIAEVVTLDALLFQTAQDTLKHDRVLCFFRVHFSTTENQNNPLDDLENNFAAIALTGENSDLTPDATIDTQIISDLNHLITNLDPQDAETEHLIAICDHIINIFNTDKENNISELIHTNNLLKFNYACDLLHKITTSTRTDNPVVANLKNAGRAVCDGAKQLFISEEKLPAYTKDMLDTYHLVKNTCELMKATKKQNDLEATLVKSPNHAQTLEVAISLVTDAQNKYGEAYNSYCKNLENTSYHNNDNNQFWSGLLLTVAGSAIAAQSIVSAIVTRGVSFPLSLLGLNLSARMCIPESVQFGFKVAVGFVMGLFGISSLWNDHHEKIISKSMDEVKENAEKLNTPSQSFH